MTRKHKPPNQGKPVLAGYKRKGKIFTPPLADYPQLQYVSWSTQVMPELIWWDVMIDRATPRFAAKVAEEIAKHFKENRNREPYHAFVSDYVPLDAPAVDSLKQDLRRADVLGPMLECLSDFLDLYPECPLAKLSDRIPAGIINIEYLRRFEARMQQLESKRSRNGVLVQAQAVYMAFVSGRLHVPRESALADFPQVQYYPETDRSKMVGASVCATVNMLAGTTLPAYANDTWVQYFWCRNLELRPLDFGHLQRECLPTIKSPS